VVFVSHQTPVMRELCHRIVWIEQGMTHMEGEVAEVLQAYHQSSQAC
jgi:lipopolysaccharide transport system ATP-binding protein